MSHSSFIGIALLALLLVFVGSVTAETRDLTIKEPNTNFVFETASDGCTYKAIGRLKQWVLFKYTTIGAFVTYECSPSVLNEKIAFIKIYTSWVLNTLYKSSIDTLVGWKDANNRPRIPIDQQNILSPLLKTYGNSLWSGDTLKFTWKSGTFTFTIGNNVIGTSTAITLETYNTLVDIVLTSNFFEKSVN